MNKFIHLNFFFFFLGYRTFDGVVVNDFYELKSNLHTSVSLSEDKQPISIYSTVALLHIKSLQDDDGHYKLSRTKLTPLNEDQVHYIIIKVALLSANR